MTWYVYILRCSDRSLYCGITNNLNKRVADHNEGKTGAKYTRAKLPVTLVFREKCTDKSSAMRREWEIKKLSKSSKETLIKGTLQG